MTWVNSGSCRRDGAGVCDPPRDRGMGSAVGIIYINRVDDPNRGPHSFITRRVLSVGPVPPAVA